MNFFLLHVILTSIQNAEEFYLFGTTTMLNTLSSFHRLDRFKRTYNKIEKRKKKEINIVFMNHHDLMMNKMYFHR